MTHAELWLTTLGVGFVSGFIPLVNIEAYLVLRVVVVGVADDVALVLAATIGQMAAKCLLYLSGRGILSLKFGKRPMKSMEKLKEQLTRRPAYSTGLLFVSAAAGIPPFYAMSILAGTLRFPFVLFFLAGFTGRLLRFSAFVWAPELVLKLRGGG